MPKKTLSDYRKEYEHVTNKKPAVRWTITDLKKKITDARILKEGHAAIERSKFGGDNQPGEVKPDFENLVAEQAEQAEPKVDGRGGAREGAGRPIGQTDERARIERLLSLEKADLGVLKFVQGLNLMLSRFSPVPFTKEQCESIALGVTLPLYYWFPFLEGAANKWTLHLQALEYIGRPVSERALTISQIAIQQQKESDNGKEENVKEENVKEAAPAAPAKKKRSAGSRSHSK